MEENRIKSFHDITARRWNDIINAVNSRRPADSIEPPLEDYWRFRRCTSERKEYSSI